MPETPEELHARAVDALRMPPVEEWETFLFDGELRPRELLPPVDQEEPRHGAGGVDCRACAIRIPQLIGSFAAVWDEVLPPLPEDVWRANVACVAAALEE